MPCVHDMIIYKSWNTVTRKMCQDVVVASPSKAPCVRRYLYGIPFVLSQLRAESAAFSPPMAEGGSNVQAHLSFSAFTRQIHHRRSDPSLAFAIRDKTPNTGGVFRTQNSLFKLSPLDPINQVFVILLTRSSKPTAT